MNETVQDGVGIGRIADYFVPSVYWKLGVEIGKKLRPRVVLMDIRMQGRSRYEAVRLMRRDPAFAESTTIAVTGYGQEEERRKTEEAGFDYHFTKPIDMNMLMNLIEDKKMDVVK